MNLKESEKKVNETFTPSVSTQNWTKEDNRLKEREDQKKKLKQIKDSIRFGMKSFD